MIGVAVGGPGVLAFMANISAKEAASNLASWFELAGLPVPDFLKSAVIDDQVSQAAATFYAVLVALAGSMILKAKPEAQRGPVTN